MNTSRADILTAAREVYLEGGIDGLTMRALAGRIGVTATALYRHFSSKEEILGRVIDQGLDVFANYLSRSLAAVTPWERFQQTGEEYLRFALEHPRDYETLFMSSGRRDLGDCTDLVARRSATFQFLVDRVSECMAAGMLRRDDPTEVALATWAHSHGLVTLYFTGKFGDDAGSFRELYQRSCGRFCRGLAVPGAC
jgi:AcrR family transcriptional regulator